MRLQHAVRAMCYMLCMQRSALRGHDGSIFGLIAGAGTSTRGRSWRASVTAGWICSMVVSCMRHMRLYSGQSLMRCLCWGRFVPTGCWQVAAVARHVRLGCLPQAAG
eukprot:jgi/Ulvmu1/8159/UM040_0056.1